MANSPVMQKFQAQDLPPLASPATPQSYTAFICRQFAWSVGVDVTLTAPLFMSWLYLATELFLQKKMEVGA